MISIIVAMSENRVIGRAGALPWRLPDDLKRFKSLTMGHPMIMGRKTFESIGRPLPGRDTIVITRNPGWSRPDVRTANSLAEAIALAGDGGGEVFIVGGGEIYREAILDADRIHLTLVHAAIEGDAFFPVIDDDEWAVVDEAHHPADAGHPYAFTFRTLDRRR